MKRWTGRFAAVLSVAVVMAVAGCQVADVATSPFVSDSPLLWASPEGGGVRSDAATTGDDA